MNSLYFIQNIDFPKVNFSIDYSESRDSQECSIDETDHPGVEGIFNHEYFYVSVISGGVSHWICTVGPDEKGMLAECVSVEQEFSPGELLKGYVHFCDYFFDFRSIINSEVIENVLVLSPPRIFWRFPLNAVDDDHIADSDLNCVETSSVGEILHIDFEVYHWHQSIIVEDAWKDLGTISPFR